ncbi:MAG: hypothetical protein GY786_23575 [Proteobacteria bacterium]|nr:hypothetical protein [Pseudomonadota bacterium]
MFRKFLLLGGLILIATTFVLQGAEDVVELEVPIIQIGEVYQIFPERDFGNSIYKEQRHLFSSRNLALFDVREVPDGYIYAGRNQSGEDVLGYQGGANTKFLAHKSGYYQLILKEGIDKRNVSKIFRLNKGKIQDLLPRRKTANGLVVHEDGRGAFFHISKGETIEREDGEARYQYTFKIHIVEPGSEQVIDIPTPITDFRSRLKMSWLSDNMLQYSLSDGTSGQVDYQ